MRNFRKYDIWIDSMSFVTDVYSATNLFPICEKFGLCNQLQRAAVSIASNIAESKVYPKRKTRYFITKSSVY